MDLSGHSVSSFGVHLGGTFTGWDPSILEMLPEGNNIYAAIVPLNSGELHKDQFINGNDWGREESVPNECGLVNENNNRAILAPSNDITLNPVCFGSCNICWTYPETVNVTFWVDMSGETVSPNGIHIVGSFPGWDPSISEMEPGIWGMISGDGNRNGLIEIGDKSPLWENETGSNGYIFSDYNLDQESNNLDKDDFWYVNIGSETKVPSGIFICGNTLVDSRDNQTYTTLQIGTQCWMAENLNIGTLINSNNDQTNNSIIEKYCYDNSTTNCSTYGGLYQWDEMMQYKTTEGVQGICPVNWHIPTDAEWTGLTDFLGGESVAGGKMKTTGTIEAGTGLWLSPNTGATNSSGFAALPGGGLHSGGFF